MLKMYICVCIGLEKIFWKNPNEIVGHPNTLSLPTLKE